MESTEVAKLAAFVASVFLVTMFALTAAAMFPREHRPAVLAGSAGSVAVYGSVVLVAALALHTIWFAATEVRWYFAVIGGGLVVLFAPGLHDALGERLREGALGLAVGAVLNLGWHGAIWSNALP